jgi:5-methylcytosine-specific restriction protein A
VLLGGDLIIFANLGTPGRTGHDFPNRYEDDSRTLVWYGKPHSHSAQPTFRRLFDGEIRPLIFVRWDNKNLKFTYLGRPTISSFKDNVVIQEGIEAIEIVFKFEADQQASNPGPDGAPTRTGVEGSRSVVLVNRFERDPSLREACIDYFGTTCQICGFSFEVVYGDLGKDFCHVHHITPLFSLREAKKIDPVRDLIPVCANCHAMLHRPSQVLTPSELREIMGKLAE